MTDVASMKKRGSAIISRDDIQDLSPTLKEKPKSNDSAGSPKGDNLMFFDNNNGSKDMDKGLFVDSPKGSVSSRSDLNFQDDDDDEDEFEDAQDDVHEYEGPQMKASSSVIISDLTEERLSLPCERDNRLKPAAIWTILKDMVGKDITKYSMPVIVNEPISNLQKNAELF